MSASAALTILSLVSPAHLGVPAGASPPPSSPGASGWVAQATDSGAATLVGSVTLGTGTTTYSGVHPLPSLVPAGAMPQSPNIASESSAAAPVAASVSKSQGRGRSSSSIYPTVLGSAVGSATSGLASTPGLNAYDQGVTHPVGGSLPGVDVEPSDQGLCASSSATMEMNNMVVEVFQGTGLTPVTIAPLEHLFKTPEIFGAGGDGSYSVQGDPRCFYDSSTGRWYASQLWLDLNDATGFGWAGTFLAVSLGSDPTGAWNVYFIPDLSNQTGTATCNNLNPNNDPTANPCFGDQPLLGVDANSIQISTNEYSIFGAFPNGQSNYYFLSKTALDSGVQSVPVWWNAIGADVATPGVGPWYSIVPAQSPSGDYLSSNGGTSYALSSLDFSSTGDHRIAEWAFTNTSAVNSSGSIGIYELTLSSQKYGMPPLAVQKSGPTPLAGVYNALNNNPSGGPLPEGPVQTNDDRMTTAAFDPSTGALVGALNTGVNQVAVGPTSPHAGVAYFVVTPALSAKGLTASLVRTGYISPSGADAFFPAVAVTPSGRGVINYVMSGPGYYPSTAYSLVTPGDQVDSAVHVAALGAGPADGFSEYQNFGNPNYYRPRWGDYSGAQVVGNSVVFASEMVNQTCSDSQFAADFTCGGTRDLYANWGTSVNVLTP